METYSRQLTDMTDSYTLYRQLQTHDLLAHRPKWWWPNAGSFEVVIGAVLTQNTTWKNVETSLENLAGFTTLDTFLTLEETDLKARIRPSGFYNQKAPRLRIIAKNIKEIFSTFFHFQNGVTRDWLLSQKGIGEETADSILNYGCFREEMVVDTYTKRLLKTHGITFKTYGEYKAYLEEGMRRHIRKDLALHFARFHGMIVEYNKYYLK
jgi:endonuclease-3 related protein